MMRRFLAFVAVVAIVLGAAGSAYADDNIAYPGMNPPSTQTNGQAMLQRLNIGAILRDLGVTGVYADITISPTSGMYVTVAPSTANTDGSVYQTVEAAPSPVPSGYSPNLPANTTLIPVRATVSATSAPLGPITAPPGGDSVYVLVETNVSSYVPSNVQAGAFLNSGGVPYPLSVPFTNEDIPNFVLKAGTPSSSNPQVPSVDSGYIPIGVILVPSGVTQITTGMITQNNPCGPGLTLSCQSFQGFLGAGTFVQLNPTPSPAPQAGYVAVTGTIAGSQLVSTVSTGTAPFQVSSTTQVANLQAATAGTLAGCCLAQNLGGNGTASPGLAIGSSGNLTSTGSWAAQTLDLNATLSGLTSVSTTNATIGSDTVSNETISTNLQLSALTAQSCLATDSSGNVIACSLPGLVSYNASAPLAVATPSGSVTYSCPTCVVTNAVNTYTTSAGNQILPPSNTATSSNNYGSVGCWQDQSSVWNGSSATTDTWGLCTDTNGNLNLTYNGTVLFYGESTGAFVLNAAATPSPAPTGYYGEAVVAQATAAPTAQPGNVNVASLKGTTIACGGSTCHGQLTCTLSTTAACNNTATVLSGAYCTASYDEAATTITVTDLLPLMVAVSSTTLTVYAQTSANQSGTVAMDYTCL